MSTWNQLISNRITISSSLYMSDSLSHALLDYQDVITSNEGQFQSLLTQKTTLLESLIIKENELFVLETDLTTVLDAIDVNQSQGLDTSAQLTQKADLESQITTKQAEIDDINSQLDAIDIQILTLKNTLSTESNLTPAQIIELDDYIFEETWEDQNYTSAEDLFTDGKKVFDDLKKPKEIISTNIINIFKILEGKQDWKKIVIGDKFFIDYERFNIDVETQLIELEINHDSTDINVTIANTKDIERDEDKLSKILYGSISTANTVDMNKYKWDQVNNVKTSVDDILEGKWNPATNGINAGNESVVIDRRGITSTDASDPTRFIRINHGAMGFTNTSGNDYKLVLDATGVYAENLVGKIVITENLFIENTSGKYTFDQFGFTILGGSFQMIDDGNGISLNPTTGFTATSPSVKATFNATDGFKFTVKEGLNWNDKFYYDVLNSRLVLNGELNASEIKVNGQSVLTGDKTKIDSQHVTNFSAEKISGGTITGVTVDVETNASVGEKLTLKYNAANPTKVVFPNSVGDERWSIYKNPDSEGIVVGGKTVELKCEPDSSIYIGQTSEVEYFAGALGDWSNGWYTSRGQKGYCGIGGVSGGITTAIAGCGVNFRMRKTVPPLGVSFTSISKNVEPHAINITEDGFYFYIDGETTTDAYKYWRGIYQA